MEFSKVKKMIESFNSRFNALDKLQATIDENIAKRHKAFSDTNSYLLSRMQRKIDNYLANQFDDLYNNLSNLRNGISMEVDTKLEYEQIELADTIEENVAILLTAVKEINEKIKELNLFNFDIVDPPVTFHMEAKGGAIGKEEAFYFIKGSERSQIFDINNIGEMDFDCNPHAPLVQDILCRINQIVGTNGIINTIKTQFINHMSINDYENFLNKNQSSWMEDEIATLNSYYSQMLKSKIVVEDNILNERNFEEIFSSGKDGAVDYRSGSNVYPIKIKLGDVNIDYVTKNSHKDYIEQSPVLSKWTPDGKLNMPYVIELRTKANMLINIGADENNGVGEYRKSYNITTYQFVHSIVMSFLMAFPVSRLNLQFVDVNKKADFAVYSPLEDINELLFGGGIFKDDEGIAQKLKKIRIEMEDVYEKKIAKNRVKNIYDYNEKSKGNPQSFNLLVITDFPKGFTKNALDELEKIVEQGNECGLFTVIINNSTIAPICTDAEMNSFMENIKESINAFEVRNKKIMVEGNSKQVLIPHNDTMFQTEDEFQKKISDFIDILKINAENRGKNNIDLTEMFAEIDDQQKSGKIKSASEIIEIPIGRHGGELQSLPLSASGEASAHAVIIGGTGSGKSNLLHTIIMSACYKYSPDELNIYLVDFKGGVEFKFYEANKNLNKQLPHIKLTGLTSDPEDGVAILENLRKELKRREDLLRNNSVEDIMNYNAKNKVKLARLFVIIDEVQELFSPGNDSLAQHAISIMSELFKKGRAFGISLLWASQNVPNASGLKSNVLSQIGNRISLRLNDPTNASELDINVDSVRNLNRPEKGLGIIKNSRNNNIEFRAAYAYNSEDRYLQTEVINKRWKKVVDKWEDRESLFVVGNGEIPKAMSGKTPFTYLPTKADVKSNSSGDYMLNIGQNYITGKPFSIPIGLRASKSHLWMAGANVEELRDMIGYCMLSVLMENSKNKDIKADNAEVYYINGELRDPSNPNDLFYILPTVFEEQVTQASSQKAIIDLFVKLVNLRKERADNIQNIYTPIFVFINKLQAYSDLFKDNKQIDIENYGKQAPPISSSIGLGLSGLGSFGALGTSNGKNMTFAQIFNEIFDRGSDLGIHLIFAMDNPSSISEITQGMKNCAHKILIKGVRQDDIMTMVPSVRGLPRINIEGLGINFYNGDSFKFKPYRYDSNIDESGLMQLAKIYKELK